MHIWTIENWKKVLPSDGLRHGLRLVIDKDVGLEMRNALKDFAAWLRTEYRFPMRVPVYVKSSKKIIASDGEAVVGLFFEPDSRSVEPYIKIAVGDFDELKQKRGHDGAVDAILCSLAHELTHYFQWINALKLTDRGSERQASIYAEFIVSEYREAKGKTNEDSKIEQD